MRFDREKLEALAALPDDKLWAEVVRIAESYGYSLPQKTPSHEDLEKMRAAARSMRCSSVSGAALSRSVLLDISIPLKAFAY